MYKIVWKLVAEDDLSGIIDFIAEGSVLRAEQFVATIRAKTETLREFPKIGREISADTHVLVVHSNYIVVYRVYARQKIVEILRVKHAAKQFPVISGKT
jgi:plasmid stabilization system protein ParE